MNAPLPRRRFFNRVLLFGGAVSVVPALAMQPPFSLNLKKEVMLDQLTLADFAPHLGGTFIVKTESGEMVPLELIEATALGAGGPRPAHLSQRAPFSVVFLAPKQSGLVQRIYRMEHATMEEFDIFLVPIGLTEQGLKCEAIFN
jgi:hypothetical protein